MGWPITTSAGVSLVTGRLLKSKTRLLSASQTNRWIPSLETQTGWNKVFAPGVPPWFDWVAAMLV